MNAPNHESFYAKREPVFPKAVDGPFRRLKWGIMAVTLAIYYLTPWLRWDRGAYAPDQAVLVDLAHRRFFMFGIEIWPHEFYYVAGLLIMAGVGLFLLTSAVGRAWCGYACPQTVWTDLFQHIERFIDGDRNAQMRLLKAPWTASKIARRVAKHTAWLTVAMLTGGAWIFYFADAPTLAREFVTGEAPFVAYATVGVLTATTYIFGGLMREQVCIYMCPWPRIQTAMMDEKSLIVTYREWRGEPRSRGLKKSPTADALGANAFGDCIDCMQCVQVCPTGVDIRNGPQIGCINCALCVDACDKIMAQIGRERGLIDYLTLDDAEREKKGGEARPAWKNLLRPRTLIYFGVWATVGLLMLFALGTRERVDVSVQQDRNPVFVRLSDGAVRNGYTLKIRNMQSRPRRFEVAAEGFAGVVWREGGDRAAAGKSFIVDVPADAVQKVRVFAVLPSAKGKQEWSLVARATDAEGGSATAQVGFEGPEV